MARIMPVRFVRMIGLAIAVVLGLGWSGLSAQELKLRILSTTDIHTNVVDWDYTATSATSLLVWPERRR